MAAAPALGCFRSIFVLIAISSLIRAEIWGINTPEKLLSVRSGGGQVDERLTQVSSLTCDAISVRGGSDDDEDAYDDDEDAYDKDYDSQEEKDDTNLSATDTIDVLSIVRKGALSVLNALQRSVMAAFTPEEEDSDAPHQKSALSRIGSIVKRMWMAALNVQQTSSASSVKSKSKSTSTSNKKTKTNYNNNNKQSLSDSQDENRLLSSDFGQYLANVYDVEDGRGDSPGTIMIGGSLNDALREARSQARLLFVFIPPSKKKTSDTTQAIRSLLSREVAKIAEKKSRKKTDSGTGSFLLWGAKAGSREAIVAMKKLQAKQPAKGSKPILLVAYQAISATTGKTASKVLAQHHCSPPPNAETMAAWLNALRKRHGKQYATMIHELKEAKLYQERIEGYHSSMKSDTERQEREREEEKQRIAKEKAEKKRLMALEERRQELLASLPDEPSKEVKGVMTIALRFSDGRTGQRRFEPDTQILVLFNWVDAMFSMERENVVLTTMNGKHTFGWDKSEEKTLKDSGLGKMTGLRVMEKKKEEEAEEESSAEDTTKSESG